MKGKAAKVQEVASAEGIVRSLMCWCATVETHLRGRTLLRRGRARWEHLHVIIEVPRLEYDHIPKVILKCADDHRT